MIKNYIKTAWRSLIRNKSYTIINITGLAVGIAACLLIFLVINFENSFDNFHPKKDHIYRVLTAFKNQQGGVDLDSGIPFPTADALRIDFPQLKDITAVMRNRGSYFMVTTNGNEQTVKKFKEDDTFYAEPQFFNVFKFDLLAGDKKSCLNEPNSIILTKKEANKFFGDWKDVIGKTVKLDNKLTLKVTGVLKDIPVNTDFPLKAVISYATLRVKGSDFYNNMQDWVSIISSNNCYVVLPENQNIKQFNVELAAFAKKHQSAEYASQSMQLQALTDLHYDSSVDIYSNHPFSKQLINAISLIGLFLLIIACVNFINLATAQAVNRSKEVGIRKVLGSSRKQLIFQFISETLIITLLAVALAIGITSLALPPLNQLMEIELSKSFLFEPVVLIFLAGLVAGVTLLAGFYPAMVLSGFNPITALKNKIAASKASGISLRRGLVVLQFCIAQVLVIGTLVIISQMNYFSNKSLGFAKDAVVMVPLPADSLSESRMSSLKNQLLEAPGIKDVSYSFAGPSDYTSWNTGFRYNNSDKKTKFSANLKWADAEYFKLYKLQFLAGQPYKTGDTVSGYVVNQALIKELGIRDPKDAIGKYIQLGYNKSKHAQITGVVKDFNVSSLKDAIPPVLMGSWKKMYQVINIKIEPSNINQSLASIEKLWNKSFPDYLYEYQFLDEKIATFYKNENQLSQLYKVFAGIAIFISCLGLYGLISFMAVQRTKEVGIRKTLGASVGHIVYLFSKEFTLLILVAFAISAPVGWYFMNKWLQAFTYKITIGPGIFVSAILLSVIIAWLTVGCKAIRSALANPVNSLKNE
ncbi:ABC transporter permease [Mucilaginibacter sp.]|uniref:ABC transporter permease n=1 Tax=Mucilaginibacter sp. TaxID=1882438 RepID=UPI003D146A3B